MRTSLFSAIFAVAATAASAQTPAARQATPPAAVRLSVDDAVRMALDHNVDLATDRLDPQIGDTRVAAAQGAFRPTFTTGVQRNNQLVPPTNFLFPVATRTDAITSTAGVSERLPWFGTTVSASWNAVHTDSNSILNSYNPLVQSGLALNLSQPLFRDLKIDSSRQQLETSRVNRAISDTRLRESIVHTTANVKTAYWNLVAALANVDARRTALELAEELTRVNKAKVDVGSSPPLDLVSAQAEVASNQEQLIIAETAVHEAEDRLRMLIYDPTDRSIWSLKLEPIDSPPVGTMTPDIDAAVATALQERADLDRARKEIENADTQEKFASNQRLPDIRFNASYQASGLGGTQVLRTGGFPGTVVGAGSATDFGSVLNQLFNSQYPTWAAGVSVSYPIGASSDEANYARTKLERQQASSRLKSAEARAIQQVRDAAWKIDMNAKRIGTTRAARELAEQRLDSEQKRFEVGMSTNFLVIQAQRDLAQAKTNELSAILAYDLSLVDFEALQLAGPAGQAASQASSSAAQTGASAQPAATGAVTTTAAAGARIPGITQ